jgi:hypothetical protein
MVDPSILEGPFRRTFEAFLRLVLEDFIAGSSQPVSKKSAQPWVSPDNPVVPVQNCDGAGGVFIEKAVFLLLLGPGSDIHSRLEDVTDLGIPIPSGDGGHMHEIIDGRLGAIDPPFIAVTGFAVPKDLHRPAFFTRSGAVLVGLKATAAGEGSEPFFEDGIGIHEAPFPVDDRNTNREAGEEVFAEPLLEPWSRVLQAAG